MISLTTLILVLLLVLVIWDLVLAVSSRSTGNAIQLTILTLVVLLSLGVGP